MQHTDDNSLCNKSLAPSAEMIENLVDGARYGDLEDVQSALQHSVAVDSADTSGRTALHMAAANDHAEVAAYLVQAGASVDIANTEGNTPLHWACLNGCMRVAKILLDAGASPASLNSHSNTPVDEALGKPYQDEMLALISRYQQSDKADVEEHQQLDTADDEEDGCEDRIEQ